VCWRKKLIGKFHFRHVGSISHSHQPTSILSFVTVIVKEQINSYRSAVGLLAVQFLTGGRISYTVHRTLQPSLGEDKRTNSKLVLPSLLCYS
jgi:hypothetical protein